MIGRFSILLVLLLLVSCSVGPAPTAVPTMEAPALKRGQPASSVSMTTRAVDEECNESPEMIDLRGADDPSFTLLRRLEAGDYEFAAAWGGFAVDRSLGCNYAKAGEKYWKLTAVELKCGPATLQACTHLDGAPAAGILTWMHWPDAPMLPNGAIPDPTYHANVVGGFTDGGGCVGWGFGPGSQLTPGEGGPFAYWPSSDPSTWADRRIGADALTRVGWFDNHCVFDGHWTETRKSSGLPPTPSDDAWLGVFEDGELRYHVPLVPGMPGGNTDEFSGLGYIAPDGAWRWHALGVQGAP